MIDIDKNLEIFYESDEDKEDEYIGAISKHECVVDRFFVIELLEEVKRMRGVIYDALYVLQTDGWNKNRADAINRLEKILIKGWEGEEE